ncbi:MAG: phosphoribosylamine--glycine ligase [Chitinophagaceae bacterium]
MNILLLGAGGREHALAWKMSQSPLCSQLFIAPGNGGTLQYGTNLPFGVNDFSALKLCCIGQKIEMVVVGPEDPLVNGVYDFLVHDELLKDIIVVGPSKAAAQLEGSKAFSKKFMQRQQIPTAGYEEFTLENFEEGKAFLQQHSLPIVLKADGLAAGKGVMICQSHTEALIVFEEMIVNKQFGEASTKVVVEEFLDGIEISVFVLTDGKDYQIIGHAKDYKRIGAGDTGLNTGGMGCVSPVPFADEVFMQKVIGTIIEPTIAGLHKERLVYNGFVFFGLIRVGEEPFVIEYNCRLGDPETEVVLPRLKNDLVELFVHMHENTLGEAVITYDEKAAVTVMAVSGGYPGDYEKGKEISFTEGEDKAQDILVFHAGTAFNAEGRLVTNGGRVITATALRNTVSEAAKAATEAISGIEFEGLFYRKDIGYEFE